MLSIIYLKFGQLLITGKHQNGKVLKNLEEKVKFSPGVTGTNSKSGNKRSPVD